MKLISTPLAFAHKHCTTTHIYSAKTYVMLPTSFKLLNHIHQIAEITPQNTLLADMIAPSNILHKSPTSGQKRCYHHPNTQTFIW